MLFNLLGLLVGMVLGTGHFALFRWSTTRLMQGSAAGRFAMLAFLALRQLVLGLAFFGVWRAFRVPPIPMALGIAVAWLLMRAFLIWRLRRS